MGEISVRTLRCRDYSSIVYFSDEKSLFIVGRAGRRKAPFGVKMIFLMNRNRELCRISISQEGDIEEGLDNNLVLLLTYWDLAKEYIKKKEDNGSWFHKELICNVSEKLYKTVEKMVKG